MLRRWIRLFPAMLVATVLIAITAHFLPYRYGGIPRLIDLVPGLTMLGANVISSFSGIQTDGLERGFWSIYVEVRFYAMFGIFYYTLGKYKAFYAMVVVSALLLCLIKLAAGSAYAERAHSILVRQDAGSAIICRGFCWGCTFICTTLNATFWCCYSLPPTHSPIASARSAHSRLLRRFLCFHVWRV